MTQQSLSETALGIRSIRRVCAAVILEGDSTVFLLHAATALEQVTKAYLASMHGSLVAAHDSTHCCTLR